MAQEQNKKLGLAALACVVVSSMVGGGIYSLPQNMAAGASAGAVLLAWLVTGVGMYFLANSFRILSDARSDLTAGVYMYAARDSVRSQALQSGGAIGCARFSATSAMP